MKLHEHLTSQGICIAEFARQLDVSPDQLRQWVFGYAGRIPGPVSCVRIEKVTNGAVTRRDLRPDDWERIWPELAYADENTAAAPAQKARAAIKPVAQGVAHAV